MKIEDQVYELLIEECHDFETVYEDRIIDIVGEEGLEILRQSKFIETCGVIDGRKLYAL